jgi:ribose transport system substrate-binding protein
MKKVMAVLLVLVMAFFFAACSNEATVESPSQESNVESSTQEQASQEPTTESSDSVDDGVIEIVFSVKTPSNDSFQSALAAAIQTSVEEAGGQFILMGAGSASNVATQVSQLEDVINRGCDGLIVNPLDSNAVIPALTTAKEKGIPVVIVDTPLPEGNEDLYLSFCGTDNYDAGYKAGKAMVEILGDEGKVALVRGANGNAAGDARADGFKAGIEGSNLELAGEQVGNWSNSEAMQVTESMLQANPDIAGLFSCSDVMVEGILQAYSDNNKTGIVTIAVDGTLNACDWIEDGDIYGTMAQYPSVMGSMAVEILMKSINGEDLSGIEKYSDSGVELITKETVADYRPLAF